MNSKHNFVLFLALTVLLLVSLACGSSASPTLVATSAPPVDSGSQPQEQPTQQAPTTPIPTLELTPAQDILTIENNEDMAALFKVSDF